MPDIYIYTETSHKKFSEGKQAHVIATELTSVGLAHARKSKGSVCISLEITLKEQAK